MNENKEVNIIRMSDVEYFDKPKNNTKKRKIENSIINKKNQEEFLNNNKKCSFLDKKTLITQPRKSFKYLVHQAYKNRNLSNSFNKYYESSKRKRERNNIKNNKQEIFIENKNNNNKSKKL